MKKNTINKLAVTHNYLTKALNSITQIDSTELDERENKKLLKLQGKLVDVICDYSTFKIAVLESRGVDVPQVY